MFFVLAFVCNVAGRKINPRLIRHFNDHLQRSTYDQCVKSQQYHLKDGNPHTMGTLFESFLLNTCVHFIFQWRLTDWLLNQLTNPDVWHDPCPLLSSMPYDPQCPVYRCCFLVFLTIVTISEPTWTYSSRSSYWNFFGSVVIVTGPISAEKQQKDAVWLI